MRVVRKEGVLGGGGDELKLQTLYMQHHLSFFLVQHHPLIDRGWPFGGRGFNGKSPPNLAVDPRDRPCRPRARKRVGVGVRSGWLGCEPI